MYVWVYYGAKSLKNSYLNVLELISEIKKNMFFIFAIKWNVTLSQQLQVHTGHMTVLILIPWILFSWRISLK